MTFDWDFFWKSLFQPSEAYVHGLWMTIGISVTSMAVALFVGLGIGLLRLSRFRLARAFAGLYIWILRGVPLLVVLVIIYLGLAAAQIYRFQDVSVLGFTIQGAVQAALVGLILNESAYVSEIVRSGIQSVPKGQLEAAASLGMRPARALWQVTLPQALRTMVPPLGNNFNSLMKNTSLLSIIGVSEVFLITQATSSATFRTFEIFIVTALYYLLLTTVWTFVQEEIEALLSRRIGIDQPGPVGRLLRLLRIEPRKGRETTPDPAPAPIDEVIPA